MMFEYNPPLGDPAEAAECEITGRGAVAADFDDDGREDLLVVDLKGPARLFHNVTAKPGHWVRIRLEGKIRNTMALGARLTARAGDLRVVREVSGSTGYISHPSAPAHRTRRRHVARRRRRPLADGREEKIGSLAADQDHVVREK